MWAPTRSKVSGKSVQAKERTLRTNYYIQVLYTYTSPGTALATALLQYSRTHVLPYSRTPVLTYSCTHVLMYSRTPVLTYCAHLSGVTAQPELVHIRPRADERHLGHVWSRAAVGASGSARDEGKGGEALDRVRVRVRVGVGVRARVRVRVRVRSTGAGLGLAVG